MSPSPHVLALALAFVLAGCGSSEDTAPGPDGDTLTETELIEAIVGRYAERSVVATIDQTPAGDTTSVGAAYGFGELRVEDGELVLAETYCHMDIASSSPLQSTIPDAMMLAIVPEPAPVTLTLDDQGWLVHRPIVPIPVGIDLEDNQESILDVADDDPRIFDADGDDQPGVTMHVAGTIAGTELAADIYMIRREIFEYEVRPAEGGRLVGVVRDSSEQVIVGATDPLFAADVESMQDSDMSRSPFELTPVTDDYTCERLMSEIDTLFAPLPAP